MVQAHGSRDAMVLVGMSSCRDHCRWTKGLRRLAGDEQRRCVGQTRTGEAVGSSRVPRTVPFHGRAAARAHSRLADDATPDAFEI